MKINKTTFRIILRQTKQKNSEPVTAKARLANRLVKKSRGSNKKMAYQIKSKAFCSLVKKLSDQVRVSKDIKLTDFVIVELKSERSGLHLPSVDLVN